eukprot:GHVU01180056.1.p1 GENE.GHVU01180056.1~~GHVU01180056.1.p1  ORF type:complete len:161 (+),score=3.78 GHVU01180056.1:151-633(+)
MAENQILPYMFEPEYGSGESEFDEENDSSDSDDDNIGVRGRANEPVQEWCQCEKCQAMPLDRECVCCKSWTDILEKKLDNIGCITEHGDFHVVCLLHVTLCMAYIQFMAYKKNTRQGSRNSYQQTSTVDGLPTILPLGSSRGETWETQPKSVASLCCFSH